MNVPEQWGIAYWEAELCAGQWVSACLRNGELMRTLWTRDGRRGQHAQAAVARLAVMARNTEEISQEIQMLPPAGESRIWPPRSISRSLQSSIHARGRIFERMQGKMQIDIARHASRLLAAWTTHDSRGSFAGICRRGLDMPTRFATRLRGR